MINLFHLNKHTIDTGVYSNLLHDKIVQEFEKTIADYVGAKYAVSFNSATSAIFLALLNKNTTIDVPSIIPPVVLNAIITSGNKYKFTNNVDWVGNSYLLHDFGDYKIIDSAQKLEVNQFQKECNPNDLMIFSFYPTKPVGGCDGGMIVSNDLNKIIHLRELALNGMSYAQNNWDRKIKFPGYKMYMNSIQCDIALRNFKLYEEKLIALDILRNIYNKEFGCLNTSNHLYRINVNDRTVFIKHMSDHKISCGIHYEAMHLNPVYSLGNTNCSESEKTALTTVSIPFHEKLTSEEINHIITTIRSYKGNMNKFTS